MHPGARIFMELALAMGLLVPLGLAQKPPAPKPPPSGSPSTTPGQPALGLPRMRRQAALTGDRRCSCEGALPPMTGQLFPLLWLDWPEVSTLARYASRVCATFGGDFSAGIGD
jgi:hypothetical protein